jgi:hypothetical protein
MTTPATEAKAEVVLNTEKVGRRQPFLGTKQKDRPLFSKARKYFLFEKKKQKTFALKQAVAWVLTHVFTCCVTQQVGWISGHQCKQKCL